MNLIWLCRLISILFALMFVMSLFVTWAPGAETLAGMIQITTGCGALAAGIVAIALNRSNRRDVRP